MKIMECPNQYFSIYVPNKKYNVVMTVFRIGVGVIEPRLASAGNRRPPQEDGAGSPGEFGKGGITTEREGSSLSGPRNLVSPSLDSQG